MPVIHYFPLYLSFSEQQQDYFKRFGFTLMPYNGQQGKDIGIILMAMPVKTDDDTFISSETVWCRYFKEQNSQIKIIQTGYGDNAPNYINWHFPPTDFLDTLAQSKSLDDGWIPQDTYGHSVESLWVKCWDGHNDSGLRVTLTRTKAETNTHIHHLKKGEDWQPIHSELSKEESLKHFINLRLRWKRYKNIFLATPFGKQIEPIDQLLEDMNPLWPNFQTEQETKDKLNTVYTNLKKIEEILNQLNPYLLSKTTTDNQHAI